VAAVERPEGDEVRGPQRGTQGSHAGCSALRC
jgi:hypothetical protein